MGKKIKTVGLDTNIFVYYFQAHPEFGSKVKKWFEKIRTGELKAVTSIISRVELLSYKQPLDVISSLREQFESAPNLAVYDVDVVIAEKTAELRQKHGFRLWLSY